MATALTNRPGTRYRPPSAHRRRVTGPSRAARRRNLTGALYASPIALVVTVLFVIPLGLMVWMSFNHWPLLGASQPNGVANYSVLREPLFGAALVFTLKYTAITTVVLCVVAFGLALLVQEHACRGTAVPYRVLPARLGRPGLGQPAVLRLLQRRVVPAQRAGPLAAPGRDVGRLAGLRRERPVLHRRR